MRHRSPGGRRLLGLVPAVAVAVLLLSPGLTADAPPGLRPTAEQEVTAVAPDVAAQVAAAPSAVVTPVPSAAAVPVPAPTAEAVPTTATVPTDPEPTPEPEPEPEPVAAAPAVGSADDAEGVVVDLVNAARAEAGCPAVTVDAGLTGLARAYSADMRDRGFFSHTDPDGASPWDRAADAGVGNARAENIARGQATGEDVMAGWLASPGHRANILDCSLTTIGVGVARGDGGPWWTQSFGS